MSTANLIREARQQAGLTQHQLAVAAGTSQPAVARYERGRAEPRADTLARLLAACGQALATRASRVRNTVVPAGPKGRLVRRHRDAIVEAARQARVRNPRVFGSVARGEDTIDSDIDLLVDVRSDARVLDMYAFKDRVEALLGCRVDVACPQVLKANHREAIERDAIAL